MVRTVDAVTTDVRGRVDRNFVELDYLALEDGTIVLERLALRRTDAEGNLSPRPEGEVNPISFRFANYVVY